MIRKRTKTIFMSSIVFFVAGAAACGVLWYMIISEGEALRTQAATIAALRAEEQAVGTLARLVDETAPERSELQGYILDRDAVPAFITELETMAAEQGVALETSNLQERAGEQYDELVVSIEISGSRNALLRVYELIESLPYHSYVSKTSMVRDSNRVTGATTWQSGVELTLSIHKL